MNVNDRVLRITRIVALTIVAIVVALFIAVLFKTSASTANAHPYVSPMPAAVQQPQSAKAVAASLNCDNFQDKFTSGTGDPAVLDDGVCWIGSQKYGIDTFASAVSRDGWLKLAEPLTGVVPKWETATAVVYKSTNP